MRKEFFIPVTNEPFGTSMSEKKGYTATYTGPKYLLLRIASDENHKVWCVDDSGPEDNFIRKDNLVDHYQIVLDAEEHTWEAAYLTHEYAHPDLPNYEETLPNGDVFVFDYPENGALDILHEANRLYYEPNTKAFIRPGFAEPSMTESEFLKSIPQKIGEVQDSKQKNTTTDEERAECDAWVQWANSALSMVKSGTPHYKVQFRREPDCVYREDD